MIGFLRVLGVILFVLCWVGVLAGLIAMADSPKDGIALIVASLGSVYAIGLTLVWLDAHTVARDRNHLPRTDSAMKRAPIPLSPQTSVTLI